MTRKDFFLWVAAAAGFRKEPQKIVTEPAFKAGDRVSLTFTGSPTGEWTYFDMSPKPWRHGYFVGVTVKLESISK